MIRITSKAAYLDIMKKGILSQNQRRVYQILYFGGQQTGAQVARKYKELYPTSKYSETVRNRITELRDNCYVEEGEKAACPISGRTVITWKISSCTNKARIKNLSLRLDSIDYKMRKLKEKRERLLKELEGIENA